MNTSEVLNKAADLIEQRGWIQGASGWAGASQGAPLCLEGAIIAAHGGRADELDEVTVGTCPAYRAVKAYLVTRLPHLFMWNDSVDRTASEVIEVLRACAVIEASRERETSDVAS